MGVKYLGTGNKRAIIAECLKWLKGFEKHEKKSLPDSLGVKYLSTGNNRAIIVGCLKWLKGFEKQEKKVSSDSLGVKYPGTGERHHCRMSEVVKGI